MSGARTPTSAARIADVGIRAPVHFVVRLEQQFEDNESFFEATLRSRGKTTKLELKADGTPK